MWTLQKEPWMTHRIGQISCVSCRQEGLMTEARSMYPCRFERSYSLGSHRQARTDPGLCRESALEPMHLAVFFRARTRWDTRSLPVSDISFSRSQMTSSFQYFLALNAVVKATLEKSVMTRGLLKTTPEIRSRRALTCSERSLWSVQEVVLSRRPARRRISPVM